MEKKDRVDSYSAVGLCLVLWVALVVFILTGSKCGGKVECQRLPDGTFSCSVETHRH